MDLKQLFNQTNIKSSDDVDSDEDNVVDNDEDNVVDNVVDKDSETNNDSEPHLELDNDGGDGLEDVDDVDDVEDGLEDGVNSDEGTKGTDEPTIDKRFLQPWNKLEKGSKMNRILVFVETESISKELTPVLSKSLKQLLFKGCESGLFNKVTDVDYDEETGIIDSFKSLEFNESTKKYKLKTGSTKNRSVSKSRSNIDRLTKKK